MAVYADYTLTVTFYYQHVSNYAKKIMFYFLANKLSALELYNNMMGKKYLLIKV